MMLTIAWNRYGFHVIGVLPKEYEINYDYYISHT
jgi:hypothetical protein